MVDIACGLTTTELTAGAGEATADGAGLLRPAIARSVAASAALSSAVVAGRPLGRDVTVTKYLRLKRNLHTFKGLRVFGYEKQYLMTNLIQHYT